MNKDQMRWAEVNIKQKITLHTGRSRSGWGKAATKSGYSHQVELSCGHFAIVPNSRYKGVGSFVRCGDCERDARLLKDGGSK